MVGRSACMTAVYIGVEVEASAEKRIRRLERRHSNSSCGYILHLRVQWLKVILYA